MLRDWLQACIRQKQFERVAGLTEAAYRAAILWLLRREAAKTASARKKQAHELLLLLEGSEAWMQGVSDEAACQRLLEVAPQEVRAPPPMPSRGAPIIAHERVPVDEPRDGALPRPSKFNFETEAPVGEPRDGALPRPSEFNFDAESVDVQHAFQDLRRWATTRRSQGDLASAWAAEDTEYRQRVTDFLGKFPARRKVFELQVQEVSRWLIEVEKSNSSMVPLGARAGG